MLPSLPRIWHAETAERMPNAADMGDITDLKLIAEELKSGSYAYGASVKESLQLAEDFDFDGIIKLADELESRQRADTTDLVIQLGKIAVTLYLSWDCMKIGHWHSGVSPAADLKRGQSNRKRNSALGYSSIWRVN